MDTVLVQADNVQETHPYYVRHDLSLRNSALESITVEKYVLGEQVYRFTSPVSVRAMHRLIGTLRQHHPVFFAGLLSGRSV
jgi:hypothetical protein